MQWLLSKVSKPLLRLSFVALQSRFPDAILTSEFASVATSEQPFKPSEEGIGVFVQTATKAAMEERQQGSDAAAPMSLGGRASKVIKSKARLFVLGKALSVIWAEICIPLAIILWILRGMLAFFESMRIRASQSLTPMSTHDAAVVKLGVQMRSRPAGAVLAIDDRSRPSSHISHMQRPLDAKIGIGPASSLRASGESSSAPAVSSAGVSTHLVSLARMDGVLEIDTKKRMCHVQAGCTIGNLLRALSPYHLMPSVVPPFPGMTVGGAFVGGSISACSSWLRGGFGSAVIEAEVLLGDGERLVIISLDGAHAELFHALSSSFHTLATVVSLKVALVDAPRFVHVQYENYKSVGEAIHRMQQVLVEAQASQRSSEEELQQHDTGATMMSTSTTRRKGAGRSGRGEASEEKRLIGMEALVFAGNNVTICLARAHDKINPRKDKVVPLSHWFDVAYMSYVQNLTFQYRNRDIRSLPTNHCINLRDFLFRYDRNAMGLTNFAFRMLPWPLTGNTLFSRLLAGLLLDDRTFRRATQSDRTALMRLARVSIIQDSFVPIHHATKFVEWISNEIGVAPLVLTPVLASGKEMLSPHLQHPGTQSNMPSAGMYCYLCVSIRGRPNHQVHSRLHGSQYAGFDVDDINEEILDQTYKAGGRTMLHAQNWHQQTHWEQMYDQKAYARIRKQYKAEEHYPDLFTKVSLRDSDRDELSQPPKESEVDALQAIWRDMMMHGWR